MAKSKHADRDLPDKIRSDRLGPCTVHCGVGGAYDDEMAACDGASFDFRDGSLHGALALALMALVEKYVEVNAAWPEEV